MIYKVDVIMFDVQLSYLQRLLGIKTFVSVDGLHILHGDIEVQEVIDNRVWPIP